MSLRTLAARSSLIALVASTAFYAAPAMAQQSGTEAEDQQEETAIIVTGSRIARQLEVDSPVPIIGINTEAIQSSGSTELSEILTDVPGVTTGLSLTNSNSQINAAGVSSVDLRGLGSNRTLTLIDGRRTVSNVITSNQISLSSIPTMFVDRVEVITGGASAIYGSDAVAGVVNIITKSGYEGVKIGGRAGLSEHGDTPRYNVDLLAGTKLFDDRLSVLFGASYEKERGLMGTQRKRTMESISYSQSADNNPLNQGTLGISTPSYSSSPLGGRFGSSSTVGAYGRGYFYYDASGNLAQSSDIADYGYESRTWTQIVAPRTSYLVAGKIDYQVTDNIELFGQLQYSKVKTDAQRGGPESATDSDDFGVIGEYTLGRISRNNPFVPAEIRSAITSSTIPWRRRFGEIGLYHIKNDRETWRAWAGAKGQISDRWNWELSYGLGRFRQQQDRAGLINYQNLQYALNAEYDPAHAGDINYARCVDADARANGCVPINIFGPGSISQEAAEYVGSSMYLDARIHQDVVQGYVSGELFDLPAGPVAIALGGEWRRDWQKSVTDDVTRLGFGSASFIAEYEGNIKAKEAFAEIKIPILADRPFFYRLNIDAAARIGDYNIKNVGSMFSYRIGGEWAPSPDIRFRGQYATAQRAPTVTNLYSPMRDDADTVVDLCNGVTATTAGTIAENCRSITAIANAIATNDDGTFRQLETTIQGPAVGNPNLKEETAKTYTIGLVFTPTFIPKLQVTVDYFNIKIKDAINQLDNDAIMRQCYGNPEGIGDNFFCNEIFRGTDGQLVRILNRDLNLDKVVRSGLDVAVDYRFGAPSWISDTGSFDLRALYSRSIDKYTEFDGIDGIGVTDVNGEIGSWKNSGQASIGYSDGGFRLRWKARYYGKAVDSNARASIAEAAGSNPPFLHVGDQWRHDIYVSQKIKSGSRDLRLYGGVNNLFNKLSPFLPSGTNSGRSGNYSGDYDIIGRYFYAGFEAEF